MTLASRCRALSIAAALCVAGCVPIAIEYTYLDAPGATHGNEICRRYGPPVIVHFEANGIRFEISFDHEYYERTGTTVTLRTAPDAVISIPDTTTVFLADNGDQIGAVPLEPLWIVRDPDGRLATADKDGKSAIYRFAVPRLPPLPTSGSIQLPMVYVNGVRFPAPRIRFEKKTFVGALPLNC